MFKDLIVVELASILAGPAVGMFFAELGATVYKIENSKTKGDLTRRWKLSSEDPNYPSSAYYASINWGKEVLMIDLTDQKELNQVYKLIRRADIVISNFKTSSAIKLGIDFETIKKIKSDIVFAHIKGYPHDDRPAFDAVLQAESGYLSMTGEVNSQSPVKMPVALIDQLAAHQLKQGILIALLKKERDKTGSYIETNLYESAIASLANQASNWLNEAYIPRRMGTLHPNIAPYGEVFYSNDSIPFLLAIGVDVHFKRLLVSLDLNESTVIDKFRTNQSRLKYRTELYNVLNNAFGQKKFTQIIKLFSDNRIPFGQINNLSEVFENPDAKGMILEQKIDGKKMKCVRSIAFKIK